MKECQFCGEIVTQGSNEFGDFACSDCLQSVASMMPVADAEV